MPLTAELRRLSVTVSKPFADKLEAARHARPDLSLEQILEKGVDLLLERSARAKGLVERPQRKIRPSKDPSRIPAHLKREAMKRAGGKCEFVLPSGETCGSTHDLEFHHVTARAKGGKALTVDRRRREGRLPGAQRPRGVPRLRRRGDAPLQPPWTAARASPTKTDLMPRRPRWSWSA